MNLIQRYLDLISLSLHTVVGVRFTPYINHSTQLGCNVIHSSKYKPKSCFHCHTNIAQPHYNRFTVNLETIKSQVY